MEEIWVAYWNQAKVERKNNRIIWVILSLKWLIIKKDKNLHLKSGCWGDQIKIIGILQLATCWLWVRNWGEGESI